MWNIVKRLREYYNQNLDLVGILDGKRAFVGPELVQIDLTNSCNNDCIACWCRSPLLGNRTIPDEIEKQALPLNLVKKVLDDCAAIGTTNIYLAGGGEPFMHPGIMDIIKHIKARGMECHVNTNFTLVDDKKAEQLVEMEVDHLIVSLWSATGETYAKTHPNKSEATFDQLIDTVKKVTCIRTEHKPEIILYNVIMNLNYGEIEAMVHLAEELGVDAVEFAVVDVIPGYTDGLLLNKQQLSEVVQACHRILARMESNGLINNLEVRIEDFYKRVNNTGAASGDYDDEMLKDIPCLIGWNFSRILADGNVNACLKSHRLPVGNIHNASFPEIWNSPEQIHFREKTLQGNQADPFFSMIGNDESAKCGCSRGCDDIERNKRLWRRMQQQTIFHKMVFKSIGWHLRRSSLFLKRI
jgi:MoaA/NifB/PqqE/SkfB family radical SAM enzyme